MPQVKTSVGLGFRVQTFHHVGPSSVYSYLKPSKPKIQINSNSGFIPVRSASMSERVMFSTELTIM